MSLKQKKVKFPQHKQRVHGFKQLVVAASLRDLWFRMKEEKNTLAPRVRWLGKSTTAIAGVMGSNPVKYCSPRPFS